MIVVDGISLINNLYLIFIQLLVIIIILVVVVRVLIFECIDARLSILCVLDGYHQQLLRRCYVVVTGVSCTLLLLGLASRWLLVLWKGKVLLQIDSNLTGIVRLRVHLVDNNDRVVSGLLR